MLHRKRFRIPHDSVLLLKASLIASFGVGLLGPIYAIYVQHIGGDLLDAGLAYALYCLVAGLSIMFIGTSELFQKNLRLFVVMGYIMTGICYLTYISVKTPEQLFFLQIFLGLANGLLEPAWDALFSSRVSEKQASTNWSMWTGGVSIVTGASAFVGAYVASISFNMIFIMMAAFCFVSGIMTARLLKKHPVPL